MVGSFKGPPEVHGHGFKVSPVGVGMFFSSQAQLHGSHWDRGEGELDLTKAVASASKCHTVRWGGGGGGGEGGQCAKRLRVLTREKV